MSSRDSQSGGGLSPDSQADRLRELIALHEEMQAQSQLYAEQSGEAFEEAARAADLYAESLEDAREAISPERTEEAIELMTSLAEVTESSFQSVGATVGGLLSAEMWNTENVVRWDHAMRRVAMNITAQLITALISFAVKQAVSALATKAATAANLLYAKSLYGIAAAYAALAAARASNKAIPGIGMVVHGGGYIMHSGGPVVMHGGGLRPDERPAILQAGEFVLRRDSVRQIGLPTLDHMNRTGGVPGGSSQSISIEIRALDGADVERVVVDKIVPILERERDGNRLFAGMRS